MTDFGVCDFYSSSSFTMIPSGCTGHTGKNCCSIRQQLSHPVQQFPDSSNRPDFPHIASPTFNQHKSRSKEHGALCVSFPIVEGSRKTHLLGSSECLAHASLSPSGPLEAGPKHLGWGELIYPIDIHLNPPYFLIRGSMSLCTLAQGFCLEQFTPTWANLGRLPSISRKSMNWLAKSFLNARCARKRGWKE